MALVFRQGARDFIDGELMTSVKASITPPDIHHIFPQAYCMKSGLERSKRNSIVNKTPLIARTNRVIGGVAPSAYLPRVLKESTVDEAELQKRIESHLINYDLLATDDFDAFFVDRAKRLLDVIGEAMGKTVAGRSSDEVLASFGAPLE